MKFIITPPPPLGQCLEHLCLSDPDDPQRGRTQAPLPPTATTRMGYNSTRAQQHSSTLALQHQATTVADEPPPCVEKQVLITLSNCAHMRVTVLKRLAEALVKTGYPQKEVT